MTNLRDVTLIIHIAYGAVLGATLPWLSLMVNHSEGSLPHTPLSVPLSLLLLFFSAWLGGTSLFKKHPYFSKNNRDFQIYFYDSLRLLLEYISILLLGLSMYSALNPTELTFNVVGFEMRVDYAFYLALYFVSIFLWNVLTKVTSQQSEINKVDFAKAVGTGFLLAVVIIFYFVSPELVVMIAVIKVLIDLLYLSHILESEHEAQAEATADQSE